MIFQYKNKIYPEILKNGNAQKYIANTAEYFCKGNGLDIGGTEEWNFNNAKIINIENNDGFDAYNLPDEKYDYIFSSHTLEHIPDYIKALKIWKEHLKSNGVLFLYLPHPEMEYWNPQNNRKHLHIFHKEDICKILKDIGFRYILSSERDLFYSFAVVGIMKNKNEIDFITSGHVKLKNIPVDFVYNAEYFNKLKSYENTDIGKELIECRKNMLKKYADLHSVILDFGSGTGIFSKSLKEYNIHNFDIMNDKIKNNLGNYDIICFWDSMEHIENINAVINQIKNNAVLLVSIPIIKNINNIYIWKHYRIDEHIHYFTFNGFIDFMYSNNYIMIEYNKNEIIAGREDIYTFALRKKNGIY